MKENSTQPQTTPYSQITHNVRVSVVPEVLEEESLPTSSHYVFSYTVTIENLGAEPVQLLERHWLVMSAERQIAEVVGPGVVGVQPVLVPGDKFTYTSGTVIEDPFGSMEGSYTLRSESGKFFQVAIPRFELLYPLLLH